MQETFNILVLLVKINKRNLTGMASCNSLGISETFEESLYAPNTKHTSLNTLQQNIIFINKDFLHGLIIIYIYFFISRTRTLNSNLSVRDQCSVSPYI